MRNLKSKLTSRKFLVCVAGIATGIGLIIAGNTIEGAATVASSIIAYLVAEGYIDAKSVQQLTGSIADNMNDIDVEFEQENDTNVIGFTTD